MPPSLSKSQIRNLGKRLRDADAPTAEDDALLEQLITEHERPMALVADTVTRYARATAAVASRLKGRESIVAKLRRNPTGPLHAIQDLAGVRVTDTFSLREQDDLVRRFSQVFPDVETKDRRRDPFMGYRAVHLIALVDGFKVEIQVRTNFQDFWAQVSEEWFRDLGPSIKYGMKSTDPPDAQEVAALLLDLSRVLAAMERRIDLNERLNVQFASVAALEFGTELEFEEQEDTLNELMDVMDQLRDEVEQSDTALTGILAALGEVSERRTSRGER